MARTTREHVPPRSCWRAHLPICWSPLAAPFACWCCSSRATRTGTIMAAVSRFNAPDSKRQAFTMSAAMHGSVSTAAARGDRHTMRQPPRTHEKAARSATRYHPPATPSTASAFLTLPSLQNDAQVDTSSKRSSSAPTKSSCPASSALTAESSAASLRPVRVSVEERPSGRIRDAPNPFALFAGRNAVRSKPTGV